MPNLLPVDDIIKFGKLSKFGPPGNLRWLLLTPIFFIQFVLSLKCATSAPTLLVVLSFICYIFCYNREMNRQQAMQDLILESIEHYLSIIPKHISRKAIKQFPKGKWIVPLMKCYKGHTSGNCMLCKGD